MDKNHIKIESSSFLITLFFILIIWFTYIIEIAFDFNFNKYGILPRTLTGLKGIFFSPFIHSNAQHLINNSIPIIVLLMATLTFYKPVALKVLFIGTLLTGIFTWLIAREAYHIGASGIVYLLFSFIFFSGILKKHFRLIALSLTIIFLYGSMIWYILPVKDEISWEGHLSGFISGLILALLFKKKGLIKEEYQFSSTEFDTFFDENGNLKEDINDENDT